MSTKIGLWEHFPKLASFKGREDRASFWPYAALVFGIVMIAGALMTLPMMAHLMQATPEFAAPNPGERAGPLLPVGYVAAYLGVTFGLAILLYAAAIVRRLHDRGRSGAWALMPLPFLGYTSVGAIGLIGSTSRGEQPDTILLLTIAAGNILYWAALLALVVLLAGASVPEPSRYLPD